MCQHSSGASGLRRRVRAGMPPSKRGLTRESNRAKLLKPRSRRFDAALTLPNEGLGTEKISINLADSDSEKLSARGFNMYFIGHVTTHGLPPSHELEAMIAAREIPRKLIGLARTTHA